VDFFRRYDDEVSVRGPLGVGSRFRILLHTKIVIRMATESLLASCVFNGVPDLTGGNGSKAHHGVTEVRANLPSKKEHFKIIKNADILHNAGIRLVGKRTQKTINNEKKCCQQKN
jgi:hypothetical protein